ncbi:MAG: NADH-quinone oxidoreductase subunit J, partial [Deltaproteobacteria bacterium]
GFGETRALAERLFTAHLLAFELTSLLLLVAVVGAVALSRR